MGLRYRIDRKDIHGKPDISIAAYRLAVFVYEEFLHGNEQKIRQLSSLEDLFPTNAKLRRAKILTNIEHERRVNQRLPRAGWTAMRIRASTILTNLNEAAESVCNALVRLKANNNYIDPFIGPKS